MSRKQENRKRKRLRRANGVAKMRRAADRQASAVAKFPDVVFLEGEAPTEFVQAVKTAMHDVVSKHTSLLSKATCDAFYRAAREGFRPVCDDVQTAAEFVEGNRYGRNYLAFMLVLGELLYSKLKRTVAERYIPFHDVGVWYGITDEGERMDKAVIVKIQSLRQVQTERGTAYYSPKRPTLTLNGRKRIVAFSHHAVERIRQRTVTDWRRYAGAGDAFAYLTGCTYAMPWQNANGDTVGFSLFDDCAPGFSTSVYAQEIVEPYDPAEQYCYRIGYCPIDESEDLWVARTLILPGMNGTPEYERCIQPRLDLGEDRLAIRTSAGDVTFKRLVENPDFDLLKSFQESGVTQVGKPAEFGFVPKKAVRHLHKASRKQQTFEEQLKGFLDDTSGAQLDAIIKGDVIFAADGTSERPHLVYGRELLERFADSGNSEDVCIITIPVDLSSTDLAVVERAITSIKIEAEYNSPSSPASS